MIRVLFAEDETYRNEKVVRFLTLQGCEVALAADAGETLRLLQEQPFDVLLLDMMMPVGAAALEVEPPEVGLEILKRIRAGTLSGVPEGLPVVALSAKLFRPPDLELINRLRVSAFLSKPERLATIAEAVTNAAAEAASGGQGGTA